MALTNRIKDLPMEMIYEIFSFLIPDPEKIEFRKELPCSRYSSYNINYDVAFFRNVRIMNLEGETEEYYENNYYLSRIAKKNGKHRYYITREEVDCIQVEYNDREVDIFHNDYISKYIGKNLFTALFYVIYSRA
jgi:hypothetical protein